tara:strand:- start:345 stop:602 length:258 start_codon:yes stop_codon:yes gene_type:complete
MIGNTHNKTKMPTKYRSKAKDGTTTIREAHPKRRKYPGNNQKCPCDSKKKYKHCCKKNVILNKVNNLHSWRINDARGQASWCVLE